MGYGFIGDEDGFGGNKKKTEEGKGRLKTRERKARELLLEQKADVYIKTWTIRGPMDSISIYSNIFQRDVKPL